MIQKYREFVKLQALKLYTTETLHTKGPTYVKQIHT